MIASGCFDSLHELPAQIGVSNSNGGLQCLFGLHLQGTCISQMPNTYQAMQVLISLLISLSIGYFTTIKPDVRLSPKSAGVYIFDTP
jgi:hypothetical protein